MQGREFFPIEARYRSTCGLSCTWAALWKMSDSTEVGQSMYLMAKSGRNTSRPKFGRTPRESPDLCLDPQRG